MNNNDNVEVDIDELFNLIQIKLLSYIKLNNIDFKKLSNNQKKLLLNKINNDVWNDIRKNDM